MAKWQQHGWRSFLYTRWAIIGVAFLGLWFGPSVWKNFWRERQVVENRQRSEMELAALGEREAKLRTEILLLKSDQGLEEKLREKFSVIRSGEGVINIMAPVATSAATTSEKSWWPKWWPKSF